MNRKVGCTRLKKEWKRLNLEKSELISQTFKENIRNYIFVIKIFNTEKKTDRINR